MDSTNARLVRSERQSDEIFEAGCDEEASSAAMRWSRDCADCWAATEFIADSSKHKLLSPHVLDDLHVGPLCRVRVRVCEATQPAYLSCAG